MRSKYHILRSVLITVLLMGIVAGVTDSAGPDLTEQTIKVIENSMARSPGDWPDEWRQHYLETIRSAVELHQDATHYDLRLEILRKGFIPCWEGLTKKKDRPLFEVYRCRMRWYVEYLMGMEFPSEAERQRLSEQYTDIWDYAAGSLLAQFPFLDPNAVQSVKANDLNLCYNRIDAQLMPVYLHPFTAEQVEQIKDRWDELRFARVDLWRRLSKRSTTAGENNDASSPNAERDYELTKESLSQLLAQVWMVFPQRPDYYVEALNNRTRALKRHQQLRREARSEQRRLEKERSRQLLQVEHISFLFVSLLETPLCFDKAQSIMQGQRPLERQIESAKGGGAYEVDNNSSEK